MSRRRSRIAAQVIHAVVGRQIQLVAPMAAGHDMEVAAVRHGRIGEEEADFQRHPRPRFALQLQIQPPAVLMPAEPRVPTLVPGRQRRRDDQMRVIQLNVPAENVHHAHEGLRQIEQLQKGVILADRVQKVQRLVRLERPTRPPLAINASRCRGQHLDRRRPQDAADDEETFAVEPRPFSLGQAVLQTGFVHPMRLFAKAKSRPTHPAPAPSASV